MLPTAVVGAAVVGIDSSTKHDRHLVWPHRSTFDQSPDDLALFGPVRIGSSLRSLCCKRFAPADQQPKRAMVCRSRLQLPQRCLQARRALPKPQQPWLKLPLVDQAIGVAIDPARHPLPHAVQVRLGASGFDDCRLFLSSLLRLGATVGLRHDRAAVLPHGCRSPIRPSLRIATDRFAATAIGVAPAAPIVGMLLSGPR